jgi:hypothetical protein
MPPPEKLLTKLTKRGVRQPRIYPLWVDARDTPADIDAKRDRLIAAGRAHPDDTSCACAGKGPAKPEGVCSQVVQPFPPGALNPDESS